MTVYVYSSCVLVVMEDTMTPDWVSVGAAAVVAVVAVVVLVADFRKRRGKQQ